MPRHAKKQEQEAPERKTVRLPKKDQDKDPREEEWFHLPHCMDCGREIPVHMKNYTVKSAIGFGTSVVCPICASKSGNRLITPYISYDGLEEIRRMGGD